METTVPELKEFLYLLRPVRADMHSTGPTAAEKEVIGDHFFHLKLLCDLGTVVLAGRTTTEDDKVFGLCVLKAKDEAAAREVMAGDPAIEKGVMTAELFPFRIAMLTGVRDE